MSLTLHIRNTSLPSGPASRQCSRVAGLRRPSNLNVLNIAFRNQPSTERVQKMEEDAVQTKVVQLQAELNSLHKAITVLNQLAAELDIHTAMQNVRQVALELLDCERVTLFLIFERRRELRAMIDLTQILRIQFGEGIAGLVAQTGGSMNLPDVYAHPMFNKEVDRATGFRTRSMLCMAVSDMTGKNVAVLQALNKKSGQPFTPADERNLKLFGTHLGNTLVKAKLHETAKREKERLQAIYTCFKSLNAAEEVGQMVSIATAALERHVIHAERVLFFLVDKPRGEMWLHTSPGEPPMRLRVGEQGGVVGACAESLKPMSWAEFDEPSSDPALCRLAPQLSATGGRIKSVLVQPIHGSNNDRVLAVVLAVNKREAEGTSDIFFEPFFTDADCDAMALFAYEVGDLLSERTLELSLLSALSVVGHNGAHPNAGPAGTEHTGGVGGGPDGDGGDGSSTPGGTCGGSLSGDEDLLRSRLIQMYLPDYKTELSGGHGVFNRNSFSAAASATANQMRVSMDRKRAAHLSQSLYGDGWAAGFKRGSMVGSGALSGTGSGGGGGCAPRRSDLAGVPNSRMSLAVRAAAARSFGFAAGPPSVFRSFNGMVDSDAGGGAGAPASPTGAPASPTGGASDTSEDSPVQRTQSSTQAEQKARYAAAAAGGEVIVPARSGHSMTAGMPLAVAGAAAAAGGRTTSGSRMSLPPVLTSPRGQQQPLVSSPPQRSRWNSAAVSGGGGGGGRDLRRVMTQERLMAPWRRSSMMARSAGGAGTGAGGARVAAAAAAGGGAAAAGGGGGDGVPFVEGSSDDVDDTGDSATASDVEGSAKGEGEEAACVVEVEAAGSARALSRGSSFGGAAPAPASPSRLALQVPEAFTVFANVQEELRAVAEETLRVDVGDPQALRTHLSCTNLTQASSPRSPCFYPPEALNSWDWDFTQFTVEELVKLAYDIFIVSGAMADYELQPKVLRNFLTAVASHYQSIPYHNFNHVCHVLQATYLLSTLTRAVNILSPLERLALLVAALCHDLDHDGHSNSFHVNSGSELARIYNDQSVMENHHCAMTFAIMSRTDCNLLGVLRPEEQRAARKLIISAILCTDMANHFAITQEFQKHSTAYEPDNEADRLLLIKMILHAADIGNAVRPFHVNHAMSKRVHREFEAQSQEEVALGLPVTFSVDTSDHVMCARVELNFLDYVVTTLWERLVDVLPELGPQLAQLRVNRTRYRRIADTGKTAEAVLLEEEQEQRQQQQEQEQADAAAATAAGADGAADRAPAGPEQCGDDRAAEDREGGVGGGVGVGGGFGSLQVVLETQGDSPVAEGGEGAQETQEGAISPHRDQEPPSLANGISQQEEAEEAEQSREDSQMPEESASGSAAEGAMGEGPGAG
ncbi:hypothetical protein PLESTB_000855000 [Pleodorina starrii]|uniref:Phosphodiesterase n=1 Tax=Pleodorina starrii TaxID=330485 RepID=A0A9W6BM94_9CHLO|nr:hypothetical protein PLESTM_001438800 [Pleodorina starrii]GLC54355.1 hypothetical protein PLESTB_000855000 [Pleodorina starrii]GLC72005.1 hypothetical protein PLESTF_001194200 [Pleodorina starrii]